MSPGLLRKYSQYYSPLIPNSPPSPATAICCAILLFEKGTSFGKCEALHFPRVIWASEGILRANSKAGGRGVARLLQSRQGCPQVIKHQAWTPGGRVGRAPWPKNIRVVKWRMFTSLISNLHNCRVKNSASVRQLCGLWKLNWTQGRGALRSC